MIVDLKITRRDNERWTELIQHRVRWDAWCCTFGFHHLAGQFMILNEISKRRAKQMLCKMLHSPSRNILIAHVYVFFTNQFHLAVLEKTCRDNGQL